MQKEQIKISKNSFELWFNTPLKTIELDNLPEKKHIEKLYNAIHFIDTNKETAYYKNVQEHFVNRLLEKNLFCVLLLNYLLSETDTTFKRKNFNINNEKKFDRYVSLLTKQLEIADNIFWGVFELVKNIVNHAKRKVGEKWEETDGNLIIEIAKEFTLKKDKNNKKLWEEYLKNIADKKIKTKSFLRISLEDNGEKGIIETTLDYMSEESRYRDIPTDIKKQDRDKIIDKINLCTNTADEAKLLFDMYFSGGNSFLVRQHKHALKGIGLYKFTKFISKSNGFLNIQTNKYQDEKSIIAFSLFDTLELKSPLIPSNLFGFSDYHIILPLQNLRNEQQNNESSQNNEVSRAEGAELSKSVYEEMLSMERYKLNNENILNLENDFNAEYTKYTISKKGENRDTYVCSFETVKDIDISPLFRSISKLFESNPDKKETIVIRNLSESSIKRLFELCEISSEDNSDNDNQPFFFKNKILLLLTKEKGNNANQGIVIAGSTKDECLKINKYINQNNANFDVMVGYMADHITDDEIRNFDNILSQYSLLVNGQLIELDAFEYFDKEKTTTLFEEKTRRQLENEIDTKGSVGYNWKETHLKIGSKLHLRDFVYGKKMFQRSEKASTFAFLLAKDIFKNIKDTTSDKKIIYTLVGYGYYSELMVSRTCDFIKTLLKVNNPFLQKAGIEYVIVKDEDDIKFSRYFHNLQNRKNTLEKLLIIVPISSTMTTCLKIENTFRNILKLKLKEDKYKDYKEDDFEIVEPFYTTVVVGDDVDMKTISEQLEDKTGKDYKTVRSVWEDVDIENKEIITRNRVRNENRRNHYNIYIQSQWHLPDTCKYCFPTAPIEERPIFVTDKVSVTPSLIFDIPKWYTEKGVNNIKYNEPYFKFEKDESENTKNPKFPILDKIHWVHYKGDGNKHFNYYFNYLDFVGKNEGYLTKWINGEEGKEGIKKYFEEDKNKRILLIAPDKAENGRFIHIINREIFDDRASVIRFDKHSDHYLNFGKFFEEDINRADSIYFVDNLMLSGKTFFSIDEILKTAQQKEKQEKQEKQDKKIKGIFSLINRMDYSCFNEVIDKLQSNNIKEDNETNSTHFYSFLQLNVVESTVLPCPLCEEEKKYKELRDTASLDCIKEYFFKKEMPYFEEISSEKLLEYDFSYQPSQKKKSSTLLQSAIIHFFNKAIALNHSSIQCMKKKTLPVWETEKGNYKDYINFKGFVDEFCNFITEYNQCCLDENVINKLKFKSNLIKVLSGQFCKKYRGIYISVFYWVLCELIAAARAILGKDYKYVGKYKILTQDNNLENLTNFNILTGNSFSTACDIDDFIDKTNYLRLLIKYASSLNIAYLLHSDFLAAINKFVNRINEMELRQKCESIEDKSEKERILTKYEENQYAFEDFKVFCAAHISRSLYENQQRAIKFERNLNKLYKDTDKTFYKDTDKTFIELLLLENTSIIRQTLAKVKNENNLKKNNSFLDDYRKFMNRSKKYMFTKIRLANELQKDLNEENPNGNYTDNEEEKNLEKIAKIVGCDIKNGGGILLYKYRNQNADVDENVDKKQTNKTENYRVIGKLKKYGSDTSLAQYFEDNADPNSFTTKFLEGITYLSESNNKAKYQWTSYALHKQDEKWVGQNNETKISINDELNYCDYADIKTLTNKADRILFIRISSYDKEEIKGEAVFVFYDNLSEKKGHDSVHDTRFIHVLRNDISKYLKSKYDNDTFKAWVEERKFLNAPDHNYYNILSDLKEYRKDENKFEFLYTLLMVKKEMHEILKTKSIKIDVPEIFDFNLKDKINYYCSMMFEKNQTPNIEGDSCVIRFHEPFFRHIMYEYLRNARKGAKSTDIKTNVSSDNGKYKISIQNEHAYVKDDDDLLEQKEWLKKHGYADSSKIKGLYLNSLLLEAIGCSAPSIDIELNNDITTFTVSFTLKNL